MARRLQAALDLPQLAPHALPHRLPPEHVAAAIPAGRAEMREPEEVERLRFAEALSSPASNRLPSKLNEPRLVGMKSEPEACEPCFEISKEVLCLMPMLEADDGVVRIAHDNHLASGASLPHW